jgi:hypothetical protein
MQCVVGIDVAARSFDLTVRKHGKNQKRETFEQTPQGHRQVVKRLRALQPTRVVMGSVPSSGVKAR